MKPQFIVRDMLSAMNAHDLVKAATYTTDDFAVHDPILKRPQPMDKTIFFGQIGDIIQAFPDWTYNVRAVIVHSNQVIVAVNTVGTQAKALELPGLPPIPATGKRVDMSDQFIFMLKDELIATMTIDSPPNGGAAEALRQLGVTMMPSH